MTIREFADGFLAGEYYFEAPSHPRENEAFLNFADSLGKYIHATYYFGDTFIDYATSGYKYKYFAPSVKFCGKVRAINHAVFATRVLISWENVDLDCCNKMNFEELL